MTLIDMGSGLGRLARACALIGALACTLTGALGCGDDSSSSGGGTLGDLSAAEIEALCMDLIAEAQPLNNAEVVCTVLAASNAESAAECETMRTDCLAEDFEQAEVDCNAAEVIEREASCRSVRTTEVRACFEQITDYTLDIGCDDAPLNQILPECATQLLQQCPLEVE